MSQDSQTDSAEKYTMTISRQTVDKLGVKMYDRVSAVVAELIANSYDADAKCVEIHVPAGIWLAKKENGLLVSDPNSRIIIKDDGIGMTDREANEFYLKVGSERRKDPRRGEKSKRFLRSVMGRKGVGKLAPFGICRTIEVVTAGGESVDVDGKQVYNVANFIMNLDGILADTDEDYHPTPGEKDGTFAEESGTTIILSQFNRRYVPTLQDLDRQLAQRFGIASANWKIELHDISPQAAVNTEQADGADEIIPPKPAKLTVGSFQIPLMPHTKITFLAPSGTDSQQVPFELPLAIGPDGEIESINSGFVYEGRAYPIKGWVALAQQSYRDDLMAGVRIYCRGKIAAQTNLFGKKSGFTGEFQMRTYLVGELHADWLDEDEDLIQTDRKDILWSDETAQEFEKWGQIVVTKIGSMSPAPIRKKVWDLFLEKTDFKEQLKITFPNESQREIRKQAEELATMFVGRMREEEINEETVKTTVDTVIMLAPHVTLDEKLREAAETTETQFAAVAQILKTARIAELSSFGKIADERVRIIERLNALKDGQSVKEGELQELVDNAPWLIDPQWAPIAANKTFGTVVQRFEEFYNQKTGEGISLTGSDDGILRRKRPDFVLLEEDHAIQLVEIKAPGYTFGDADMTRLRNYFIIMDEFMGKPGNQSFLGGFRGQYMVTLVCDEVNLSLTFQDSYNLQEVRGRLKQMTWSAFLSRTQLVHQNFLDEARRQRLLASSTLPAVKEIENIDGNVGTNLTS